MLAMKVPLKDGQKVKAALMKKGVLCQSLRVDKEDGFLFFPLERRARSIDGTTYALCEREFRAIPEKKGLKERLTSVLSAAEMTRLKRSADIVGSIVIIELDAGFDRKKNEIAEEFLRQNKAIKTVLRKQGGHEGELRLQKYEWLAGERTTVATHKENGAIIRLDVQRVYYSPRTATERLRVARQVKPGEKVLVMFSGCAPFPCVIAKNAHPASIVGIELNPDGHRFGLENVHLNKLRNVTLIKGDVRAEVPKLIAHNNTAFDRIIMPLPKTAGDFLDVALSAAHQRTVIHFYSFQKDGELDKAADIMRTACNKAGTAGTVLRIVKAGQIAPRTYRVCVDAEVGERP